MKCENRFFKQSLWSCNNVAYHHAFPVFVLKQTFTSGEKADVGAGSLSTKQSKKNGVTQWNPVESGGRYSILAKYEICNSALFVMNFQMWKTFSSYLFFYNTDVHYLLDCVNNIFFYVCSFLRIFSMCPFTVSLPPSLPPRANVAR